MFEEQTRPSCRLELFSPPIKLSMLYLDFTIHCNTYSAMLIAYSQCSKSCCNRYLHRAFIITTPQFWPPPHQPHQSSATSLDQYLHTSPSTTRTHRCTSAQALRLKRYYYDASLSSARRVRAGQTRDGIRQFTHSIRRPPSRIATGDLALYSARSTTYIRQSILETSYCSPYQSRIPIRRPAALRAVYPSTSGGRRRICGWTRMYSGIH